MTILIHRRVKLPTNSELLSIHTYSGFPTLKLPCPTKTLLLASCIKMVLPSPLHILRIDQRLPKSNITIAIPRKWFHYINALALDRIVPLIKEL